MECLIGTYQAGNISTAFDTKVKWLKHCYSVILILHSPKMKHFVEICSIEQRDSGMQVYLKPDCKNIR